MLDFVPVPKQFIHELSVLLTRYGLTPQAQVTADLIRTAKTHEEPLPTSPEEDTPPWEEEKVIAHTAEEFHLEFSRKLAGEIPQATQPERVQSKAIFDAASGLLMTEDLLNYLHYLTSSRDSTYNRHIIGLIKTLAQDGGAEKVLDLGQSYLSKRGMAETVRQRDNAKLADDPPPPPVDPTKQRLEARMRQILKGQGSG